MQKYEASEEIFLIRIFFVDQRHFIYKIKSNSIFITDVLILILPSKKWYILQSFTIVF